ncbi:MAG: hypothetical protein JWM10_1887 [Myxococcaceae bacterium]|nr:hypothetical protein [Myxococcaceae bacterium]
MNLGERSGGLMRLANSIPFRNPLVLTLGLLYASLRAREIAPSELDSALRAPDAGAPIAEGAPPARHR